MKTFYTYIITNTITNKQYVGSHICYKKDIYNDLYMGSSKYLKNDLELYGKSNFIKEILKSDYQNAEEMLDGETFFILKYNTLTPNGYNRFLPNQRKGFHMNGCHHSKETKQQMSISGVGKNKGRILSEDHKKNISNALKGKTLGKILSKETKELIRQKNIGKKLSEDTKLKISKSTKGIKKLSEDTKLKIKNNWKGKLGIQT